LVMPPLQKTCPKMVRSQKGVGFSVKDVFAKNFLVPGEIPRAARSHRFFGNTLVKAGHLMRPSVVSGTVRGLALQGGQGFPPRFRTYWAAEILALISLSYFAEVTNLF